MELVYSIYSKPSPKVEGFEDRCLRFTEGKSIVRLSTRNVVAWSTHVDLVDSSSKPSEYNVYVADLNVPWHHHKITSCEMFVTALEWDFCGLMLLIADASGQVGIWEFKDYSLNEWVCLGTVSFSGEYIIGGTFFHNGKKMTLFADKKDVIPYTEKFGFLRFSPSVKQTGGCSMVGCLLISTAGIISAVVFHENELVKSSEILGPNKLNISLVDVCYGKNGHFIVVVSNGSANCAIQCYRVSVQFIDEKCHITSQALPSFHLRASSRADNSYSSIEALKFVVREDADSLVVAANGKCGSLFEIWELSEKKLNIHSMFSTTCKLDESVEEPSKTYLWEFTSSYISELAIESITTSKLCMTNNALSANIIVAFSDMTVQCFTREPRKIKKVSVGNLNRQPSWWDQGDAKRSRQDIRVTSMELSWLGNVLVVVDSVGQLSLFRVVANAESGGPLTVNSATTQLEFCLVSGIDWFDLQISLQPVLLEPIYEKLTENFKRQPPAVQQYYFLSLISFKSSICRMMMNGQTKAGDLLSLLMLYSISTAFKSLLRPSDLSSPDRGPAESVAALMSEPLTDVDKVLLHLEPKEFTVEPSTLQALQQLIQWVADLALSLLARLPEHHKLPGHDLLLSDLKALNVLRELLAIIRIWGLLNQSCLPIFSKTADSLDVLGLIFKLLSRYVQCSEPDEALLDECSDLPYLVCVSEILRPRPVIAIATPLLFQHNQPIQLEFGVEPEFLKFVPEVKKIQEEVSSCNKYADHIRHLFLGVKPVTVKQCCRCGGRALVQVQVIRVAALRAWDSRWAQVCLCGGRWMIRKIDVELH